MTIAHNHFYYGHGMSIGSETNGGASAIRVFDLSINGADNGIRIKSNSSRGGLVQDIVYEDVCIRGTKNPLLFDTHYSGNGYVETQLFFELAPVGDVFGDQLQDFFGLVFIFVLAGGGAATEAHDNNACVLVAIDRHSEFRCGDSLNQAVELQRIDEDFALGVEMEKVMD